MQRGIAAGDYELVVVDNGSPRPVDREACEAFGATIRWLDVEDPTPSPAPAANLGIREARAELVGVFIDGARMASPGLLAHALCAARLHDRPVISTLSYHLGHRPQYEAVPAGHDEAAETALLATVDWESNGYRLFDVSVPGHRGFVWSRRPFETNGLFMPAPLWNELGGFDEQFVSAGGGLVNPDSFERAVALPGVKAISLLGEATFHQVHGGVSTNPETADAPLADWHAEFERLRGRRFGGPTEPILCVGTPAPEAATAMMRRGVTAIGVGRRYVDLLKDTLATTPADRGRLDAVDACVSAMLDAGVPGDVAGHARRGTRQPRRGPAAHRHRPPRRRAPARRLTGRRPPRRDLECVADRRHRDRSCPHLRAPAGDHRLRPGHAGSAQPLAPLPVACRPCPCGQTSPPIITVGRSTRVRSTSPLTNATWPDSAGCRRRCSRSEFSRAGRSKCGRST